MVVVSVDDRHRFIADLLVRAGMLMEDTSVLAISSLPRGAECRDRIREIALASAAIGALTVAAWCLSEL